MAITRTDEENPMSTTFYSANASTTPITTWEDDYAAATDAHDIHGQFAALRRAQAERTNR